MSGPGKAAGMPGRGEISLGARFVLLAAVSLTLMVVDHRQDHLSRVRQLLTLAVYPLHAVVDLPFTTWSSLASAVSDRREMIRENERLKTQLVIAQYRLQGLNALARENQRLRELLDSYEELDEDRVLIAEILSVDLDHYSQRFIINRGSVDGVYPGQPLLDADGVVGQVESVSRMTSEALLITDADHAIPVAIERTGLRTIAEGTGDSNLLRLPYLTNSADVVKGDRLVTSGLGDVFPAGRPVGIIEEFVMRPGQNFAHVTARPVAALDRDQEVLLVWHDVGEGHVEPAAGAVLK
ncbi:MAG TPA: rod shape-determining protein MreC [Gammaproteobacteria bacterium]|nr:rod shape-determining protein MreC [Gammaproteobacteria bacterium]